MKFPQCLQVVAHVVQVLAKFEPVNGTSVSFRRSVMKLPGFVIYQSAGEELPGGTLVCCEYWLESLVASVPGSIIETPAGGDSCATSSAGTFSFDAFFLRRAARAQSTAMRIPPNRFTKSTAASQSISSNPFIPTTA